MVKILGEKLVAVTVVCLLLHLINYFNYNELLLPDLLTVFLPAFNTIYSLKRARCQENLAHHIFTETRD